MSEDLDLVSKEKCLFRPFTRQSLAAIEARIATQNMNQKEPEKKRAKGEVRNNDEDVDRDPQPDSTQVLPLPLRMRNLFPPELTSIPLEDIDPFYQNQRTFVVINKRKEIFRFSATNALWILSPLNLIRRGAISILVHPLFSWFIIAAILLNCILMIMPKTSAIETTEVIFTGIYTFELIVKIISRGLILQPFTYFRDPWNWLDFVIVASAYMTLAVDLNTVRVLRVLKIVPIVPGLKIMAGAVTDSMKNLKDVIILTIFSLSVFALMGLQVYMGLLTQKCIMLFPEDGSWGNLTDENWERFCQNESNWYSYDNGWEYSSCGNSSGARQCEQGYVCLQGYGPNPNYGYTNFDTFGWAFLSAIQLLNQDYWEYPYQLVLKSAGLWHVFFFVLILLSSFFIISLILAIIVMSYDKFQKNAKKNEQANEEALQETNKDENDKSHGLNDDNPFDEPSEEPNVAVKRAKNDKNRCLDCVTTGVDFFCVWDCCWLWLKFQGCLALFVFDPFFDLFITFCIIFNTLFMALDHHDMDRDMEKMLKSGNYFFTTIYLVEAMLKITAMSPKYYFKDRWNTFDFSIVALSLLELVLEGVQGLSVLRAFRLLRIFRLGRYWPTLNLTLSLMGRTMEGLGSMTVLICIVQFIFAVMGMELFGRYYTDNVERFPGEVLPRWNFTDFMHSFMIVFRALCGEWIESMWDCMLVADVSCVPYFMSIVIFGKLMLLYFFIALLISNLGWSRSPKPTTDQGTNKIAEAFKRISRLIDWIKRKVANFLNISKKKRTNKKNTDTSERAGNELQHLNNLRYAVITQVYKDKDSRDEIEIAIGDGLKCTIPERMSKSDGGPNKRDSIIYADEEPSGEFAVKCCLEPSSQHSAYVPRENKSKWGRVPRTASKLIDNTYFKTIVMIMILISSLTLTLEDIYLHERPILQNILFYLDGVFVVFFITEMMIMWLALGFKKYFTNAWCWLDFIIVMISLTNFIVALCGAGGIWVFKTMRKYRALRPLRATSRINGIRVVVNALVKVIPPIVRVLLVCLIFWLVFAIMGVQLFAGKYFKCVDTNQTTLHYEIIPDRLHCILNNYTWENSPMNFDHVGNAYLSLFQVATFKGWIQIMNDAIDSREVGAQPIRETNVYMYLYFIYFIIFCSFYLLILFIGVLIDNFDKQEKKLGGYIQIFMTESQSKNYNTIKMDSKKPLKAIPKPKWRLQAVVFKIVTDKTFEIIMMIIICLDMLTMTSDHYQQSEIFSVVLDYFNLIFIMIYSIECLLKIFALRHHYFLDSWNLFDFFVVVLSILSLVLSDIIEKYFVSPILLRVVKVAKIVRVLRLVRFAKGIRKLLFAVSISLPALFNFWLLLFLVMFVYAIFGMSFFMHVKEKSSIDDVYNFKTFVQSVVLLFQMSTFAGWDGVLDGITNEEECDLPDDDSGYPGNCGSATTGITYLLSYLIISFFIIVNMYLAVIFEIYSQVTEDGKETLTDEDYDKYYDIWQRFDPDGTQYIRYDQLSDFLNALEPPLKIQKPNKYKIISLNIPICRGDMVFWVDVLSALRKDFFQRNGKDIEDLDNIEVQWPVEDGYEPVSSTQSRPREDYYARLVQQAWRKNRGTIDSQGKTNASTSGQCYDN